MPSTPSDRLLLELQATGENLNAWGEKLNTLFAMLEAAIRGVVGVVVNTTATLDATSYAEDDATHMVLSLSGTGGTLTIPGREAVFLVHNGSSGDITLTTGSGVTSVVEVDSITFVFCDGTNVRQLGFDGLSTKGYIDQELLSASAGNLPGQSGNSGKYLTTDGTNASWAAVAVAIASVTGFPSQSGNSGRVLTTDGSALSWLAFATAAEIRAAAGKIVSASAAFEAHAPVTLTDATTISPTAGLNFDCTLTASGRTIGAPSGWTAGQSGRFALTTGGTYSINWNSTYKKINSTEWPSTFGSGGPHIFGYYYNGTNVELTYAGQRAS